MVAFQLVMKCGALFSKKIKLGVDGRRDLLEKIRDDFPSISNGRPVAWFHSASLGEFEQGRPVIEAFKNEYPNYAILLTFFSPSGYEIRKNYEGADYICYLPVDTLRNAREFVSITRPRIAFFIKYEFWFNYLRELKKADACIFSFSTIFRSEQVFFKWYGGFYRNLLAYFDHVFVQNDESLRLLDRIGTVHFSIAGDTRFDRVKILADQAKKLPVIEEFVGDNPCLIAGSVWETDMQILIPAINSFRGPLKLIIAPHEIKKDEIEVWRGRLMRSSVLHSEYKNQTSASMDYDILIIDNIGMLSSLYRYGSMAYIGGAFGVGLHNTLEAATYGLPIFFGNKSYKRFQEARDLVENGGAVPISNAAEASDLLERWSDRQKSIEAGLLNQQYVSRQTGATGKIMSEVKKILS